MSATRTRPMAALDAAMLGGRAPARRVPLTFGPVEDHAADMPLPEVLQQVARLAHVFAANDTIATPPTDAALAPRRVAFTLRLDAAHHGLLRRIARAQRRSAQTVLIDALDRYDARPTGATAISATVPSPSQAQTGNQP